MRIASLGHAVFAIIFAAFGILGLMHGTFTPLWQPSSSTVPARELLCYLCAAMLLR